MKTKCGGGKWTECPYDEGMTNKIWRVNHDIQMKLDRLEI